MKRKKFTVCIILLFILILSFPSIPGFNPLLIDEYHILKSLKDKELIRSNEVHLLCVGRIDNLTVNETDYSFDCINVRLFLRFYHEGLLYSGYLHYKMSNSFEWLNEGESWEITFTHYDYKEYTRFHIGNCNFSGILKPTYIFGTFSFSINNTTCLLNRNLIENDKLKSKNENSNMNHNIIYRAFFMGNITDLEIGEDSYYFNASNIFRVYYRKIENYHWERGIERRIDKKCTFHIGGTRFIGIIRPDYICGLFLYPKSLV